jgi:phenylalanyl-tRNA synthetase beta chain
VAVPSFRLDVTGLEDVAEEIARAHGYDRIPGVLSVPQMPAFRPDPSEPRHRLRRVLAALGLDEIVSHALIGPDDLRRSGYDPADESLVRVANPLAETHSIMRPVMYPSMLAALAENVRQRRGDPWLFEVGKTYHAGVETGPAWAESAGTGRWEAWHVAIGLLGPGLPASPGQPPRDADLADLKGVVEALHHALGAPPPSYRAETPEERHDHLHPGRAGRILDPGGAAYGSIGEVHPVVAEAWGLPGRPVMSAINLGQLFALLRSDARVRPVPAAQPIDRDLAVIVDEGVPVGDLLSIVRASAGPLLSSSRVFDVYRGDQVGEGRVSYAIALRFQPEMAGDETSVERAMKRVRGSVQHHLGAQIR